MSITKIFHVADVHIRTTKRHSEYLTVFERLFKYIQDNKDDDSIIVLAGDIVHSKTNMSPEMIELTTILLKRCADLLPTILIAGNHDFLVGNSDRMDALTPIVNAINHPNLLYWKYSGVREFKGYNFSVLSIADSKEKWVLNPESPSIGLFHGPVHGIKNEFGFDIGQSGISTDLFDGFDYVLLGDIHNHSYLSDTVAYPGSLICQDRGEHPTDHGIIVWDLANKSSEYVRIPNDYTYVTFDLNDENCMIPDDLPPNLRARIKFGSEISSDQIQSFIRKLNTKYNVIELIKQKDQISEIVTMNRDQVLIDSRNVDDQNKIISEYLRAYDSNIDQSDLDQIFQLNKSINNELNLSPVIRNVEWKLKHLEFSNMFSYGSDNTIDFTKLSGCYGIFAPNASGKSNLLAILCFVLYDKTPITSKSSHILNNRRDEFYCKLQFEMAGVDYFIERIGTKKSDGNVKVAVNFWKYDLNDQKVNLNGEDRDKTNFIIREYVGQYDNFVMTSLSTQYDNRSFVEKTQRERKDLLYKFLDITIYEDLYKIAKEQSKEYLTLIKNLERDNLNQKSQLLRENIEKLHQSVDDISDQIDVIRVELNEKTDELVDLNKQIIPIDDEYNIDMINENINNYIKLQDVASKELIDVKNEISGYKKTIKSIKIPDSPVVFRSDLLLKQGPLRKKETEFKSKIQQLESEIRQCEVKQGHLSNHEYDPNCKYCTNNAFVIDANDAIKRLPELKNEFFKKTVELSDICGQISLIDLELSEWDEYNEKVQYKKNIESSLEIAVEKQKSIGYKIKNIKNQIKSFTTKRLKYEKNQRDIERNIDLLQRSNHIKTEIDTLQKKQVVNQDEYKKLYSKLERDRSEYDQIIDRMDQYMDYVNKYRIYDLYLTALSRDGVPYKILEVILPVIESEVNNILQLIAKFTVRLESTDEKYIHAYIVYDDDKSWPVELTSGMERFILSLAFRTALTDITSLPKSNFLAIDEGFGVLDSDNLLSLDKLFDYLKSIYEYLLVISHIDSMKDLVDDQITIGSENDYSKIKL